MGSPIPPAAAPIEQAAVVVHQWTDDQLAKLIKAIAPQPGMVSTGLADVKAFIAKLESEVGSAGKSAVAEVKSIPWSHVYAVLASTAALALHFVKYIP